MRKVLIVLVLCAFGLSAQIDLGVSISPNRVTAGWSSEVGDLTDATGIGADLEVFHRSMVQNYPLYVGLEFGYAKPKLSDENLEAKVINFGVGGEFDFSNYFNTGSFVPFVGVSMGYASWEVTKDETTVKPSGVYVGGSLGFYYQLPVSFPLNMKVAMHAQYALTKKTDEFSNYGIGKLSIGLLTPISG